MQHACRKSLEGSLALLNLNSLFFDVFCPLRPTRATAVGGGALPAGRWMVFSAGMGCGGQMRLCSDALCLGDGW